MGVRNYAKDGLNGLWTDGEMTVEAIVEQELDLAVWLHRRTREATIEQVAAYSKDARTPTCRPQT